MDPTVPAMSANSTPAPESNTKKTTSSKTSKRRKIRRLVNPKNDKKPTTSLQFNLKLLMGTSCILMALLVFNFSRDTTNSNGFFQNFLIAYQKQYQLIVHGSPNYCDHQMDTQKVFVRIRQEHILHQDDALHQLEVILRNETLLNPIAIVGPSGVGKSLWARAFEQNFPWPENVHTYAWNTFVQDEVEKFHLIRMLIENLSDCGRNLLVIENLMPYDREVVPIFNKLIAMQEGKKKHVVVVYIFNLNTLENNNVYQRHYEMLQDLSGTKTVNFRRFTARELRDCVRREALVENLTLSYDDLKEIYATIDVANAGCKNVRGKVLVYGKPA